MRYIFDCADKIKAEIAGRHIMLFLDYDGTLTPIVDTPDKAGISEETKSLLRDLSESPWCRLAIISGRAIKDVRAKVGLKEVVYSGNHGLEIIGPQICFTAPVSTSYKIILERIKDTLKKRLSGVKGALIEDKGMSFSLHYRLVDKKKIALVKTVFHETTAAELVRRKINIKAGEMVLEVTPATENDKGKVVLWLLAREQFRKGEKQILPIYIGDDLTDEDAFKALKNKGLTVLVGKKASSQAKYYLKDTKEVRKFLESILQIIKGKYL